MSLYSLAILFHITTLTAFLKLTTLSEAESLLRYSHFPTGLSTPAPVWVEVLPPVKTSFNTTSQSYRITPPRGLSNLAVTFVYEDTSSFGSFIRVTWENNKNAALLCNNLREGSGFINKRTLLIGSELLTHPGILNIQSSSAQLGVTSVHFVWVMPTEIFIPVDETPEAAVITDTGRTLSFDEIAGLPPSQPQEKNLENAIQGDLLTVPILELPLAFSKPNSFFEFTFAGEAPAVVRLQMQINGLDAYSDVEVFFNGYSIGALAIEQPDLRETGYQWTVPDHFSPKAQLTYVGWREAAFLIPGEFLKQGKNFIHFRATTPDTPHIARNMAIKNMILQLKFRPLQMSFKKIDSPRQRDQTTTAPAIFDQTNINTQDDLFEPLPVAEPKPEIKSLLNPAPVQPGAINDINPQAPLPVLWDTGFFDENFSRNRICNFPSNNESYT